MIAGQVFEPGKSCAGRHSGTAEEAGNVIKIDGFLKSQALGPGQDLVCLVMFSQSAPYEN
jgi:hypothetical protein